MFNCQARSYSPAVPLDPAIIRDNVLDYGTRTFWALVVAAIALLIARAVRGVTMRALARNRAQANVTILVGNLAQLTVIAIGALMILAIYTQGAFAWILTSFSVVGIVIGLSAQDILKNFFAGVWVLIERPFRIGDSIEVTGYTGTVEEIAFRTTQLRTEDGREVIVPNGTFMTSAVVNLTRFPTRRASAVLVLPADEKAVTTDEIRAALAKADGVSPEPPPQVELRSVGDGKAQYLVTFWAANRDATLAQALRALRARFPQGSVHIG
jgi:small conductance mechanosensitive channel